MFRCTPFHESPCRYPRENVHFENCAYFRPLPIDIAVNLPDHVQDYGPPARAYATFGDHRPRLSRETVYVEYASDPEGYASNFHRVEEAIFEDDYSDEHGDSSDGYDVATYSDEDEPYNRPLTPTRNEVFNTYRGRGSRRDETTAGRGNAARRGRATTAALSGARGRGAPAATARAREGERGGGTATSGARGGERGGRLATAGVRGGDRLVRHMDRVVAGGRDEGARAGPPPAAGPRGVHTRGGRRAREGATTAAAQRATVHSPAPAPARRPEAGAGDGVEVRDFAT